MNARFARAREPMNSYTHYIGALMALFGILLAAATYLIKGSGQPARLLYALVFCLSMLALYSTSAYYHYYNGPAERLLRLRKLDHAMIYVLIAGSYTPMVLTFFPPRAGRVFAVAIWVAAAVGILLKVRFFAVPRWVSTALYLLMGWSIFDPASLRGIPTGALVLLAAGGVCYTIGAVVYALKKPNLFRAFGFHELFHIFVILGSCLHFLVLLLYVL